MTPRTGFLAAALLCGPGFALAGPFDEALKTVPPSANVAVFVDVKGLTASQVGKKSGWAEKLEYRSRAGLGVVPPQTDRVLIAGQLNLAASTWVWKAAVLEGTGLPALADFVPAAKADADEIAGHPVALSPRGVYFVELKPRERLAVFQPANRQALGRWASHPETGSAPSKYLTEAARNSPPNQVVLALDLHNAIDPVAAREAAASLFSVVDKGVDPAAFGKFLSRARGVTFTARAEGGLRGTLRIHFSDNPLKFEKVLKSAVLETLGNEGAEVSDLVKWQQSFGEYAYTLSGPLSPESLERILGAFAFPQVPESGAPAELTAANTRRYVDAVRAISEDVRNLARAGKPEKTVLWHETGARKIEQLDPRGVDPEALEYGRDVANRLRAIAGSLRGVPIDLDRLARSAYSIAVYRPFFLWGGGPTDFQTNVPQVRAEMEKVIAEDLKTREMLWSQIEASHSDIRAKLAAKYKE